MADGREITESENKRWRARLDHANAVWKDHGLHEPDDPACSAKMAMMYYRGDQGDGIGLRGIDPALYVVDNLIFAIVNVLAAGLYARDPKVDVSAEDPQRKPNAENAQKVVNHLVQSPKLRIKRELNRILLDALLLQFGVARHGFTVPREKADKQGNLLETYDAIVPLFPWVKRVAPWDFRCDTLAETMFPEHSSWCMFRDLYPLETIRKSPAFIYRDDLVPTRSITGAPRPYSPDDPDEFELVEVWTVYDKIRHEVFRLSPGSERPISKAKPWPISWGTLPYNLLQFNPDPMDPMGTSFVTLGRPLQDDINRVLTMAVELARRLRRLVFVNTDHVKDEDKEKIEISSLVEMIQTTDVQQVMKDTQVGGGFESLLLLHRVLKDELRGLFGIGEMERGQRINVETAAEATGVAAGSQVQRSRNQAPFEEFLGDTIETFARGVQQTTTQDISVPIIGAENASDLFSQSGYWKIPPEEIQGEFQYRIRPGSTLPPNPNADARIEAALNSVLAGPMFGEIVNWPQRAVDTVLAFEKDPAMQLMSPQQMQQMAQQKAAAMQAEQQQAQAQAMAGGKPAPPRPGQNGAKPGGNVGADIATLLTQGGRQ